MLARVTDRGHACGSEIKNVVSGAIIVESDTNVTGLSGGLVMGDDALNCAWTDSGSGDSGRWAKHHLHIISGIGRGHCGNTVHAVRSGFYRHVIN